MAISLQACLGRTGLQLRKDSSSRSLVFPSEPPALFSVL